MASTTIFRLRFNRNYTTFIKIGRGHVKVDFTPVVLFGRTENSQFGTADPEVIEGLKRHRDFGSLFFIEEEGKSAPDEAKAEKTKEAESGPVPAENGGDPETEAKEDDPRADVGEGAGNADTAAVTEADKMNTGAADNLIHEKSVTSKNKAIAYLKEKHGAAFSQTADIAAMKEEARSVFNLVFDNWK